MKGRILDTLGAIYLPAAWAPLAWAALLRVWQRWGDRRAASRSYV